MVVRAQPRLGTRTQSPLLCPPRDHLLPVLPLESTSNTLTAVLCPVLPVLVAGCLPDAHVPSAFSGERKSLRLREAPGDVDPGEHGGPPRADPQSALRALPALQVGGDGLPGQRW